MNSSPRQTHLPDIPDAVAEPQRSRAIRLVWIIPIVAALVGILLAIKSFTERGPVITITFKSGDGLEAGRTMIKYKDVEIGKVKNIVISKDHSHVIVTAELKKEASGFAVEDTRFWVVQARISGGSVSGLGTLFGGTYIDVDAGTSSEWRDEFAGLERPPVVTMDVPGRRFTLQTKDIGSLDIGSPIYYRRIQVGEVISYELDKGGEGVTLRAFIRAPYDGYVKSNTFFWHASGINLTFDVNGVNLNTESVASVLLGGISFQTMNDKLDAPPAPPDSTFILFPNRDEAMKRPDKVVETYVLVFKESVRGLYVGAPVDLRGVIVGEVTKINVELDPLKKEFAMPVEVQFYPERLRAHYRNNSTHNNLINSRDLLNDLVEHGFRAQIHSGNLLTGQQFIALDFFRKAQPEKIDWSKKPPEFPTIPSSLEQFQTTLSHIAQKIEKMPLEELAGEAGQLMQSLENTLENVNKLIKNVDESVVPEARSVLMDAQKTMDDARRTFGAADKTLSSDSDLQHDLREMLQELTKAAQSLRVLSDYLERHPESIIRGKREDQ